MARARTKPQTTEAADGGKTVTLKYTGPPGQSNRAVGQTLEPGESYEVPAELAEAMVAGSKFWEEEG